MIFESGHCDINKCVGAINSLYFKALELWENVYTYMKSLLFFPFQGMCGSRSADNLSCPSPLNVMEPVSLLPFKSLGKGTI